MSRFQIVVNSQPIDISLVPTSASCNGLETITVEPVRGSVCGDWDCYSCALYHANDCASFTSILRYLTTVHSDQFANYPELLL